MITAAAVVTVLAALLLSIGRWSAEDNLTECAYEAEKLLVGMRAQNTSEKVAKRSNLVYACMSAKRFLFDFDAYTRISKRNPLPGEEDDARKDTFVATAPEFWKRD
jgi:hypothetical protein